jgi:hypothetical protein
MLLYIARGVYTFGYEYILFRRLHEKSFVNCCIHSRCNAVIIIFLLYPNAITKHALDNALSRRCFSPSHYPLLDPPALAA